MKNIMDFEEALGSLISDALDNLLDPHTLVVCLEEEANMLVSEMDQMSEQETYDDD